MKVVIGYDGSEVAKDAIHELHRAGLSRDTRATVMSVADVSPQLPPEAYDPAAAPTSGWEAAPIVRKARALAAASRAEAQALAAEGGALLKAEFPDWSVSHAAYAGSPYEALIRPADGMPDLIVVGSQGKSALGRLVFGSVSQKVLEHARCSVRISRRAPRDAPQRGGAVRVIVGMDGSRHAALAVSAVAARGWPPGTEVKVVAAIDLKLWSVLASPASSSWATPWSDAGPSKDDVRAWAYDALETVAVELRAAGLVGIPVVEEADPKQLLVEEAQRWSADCVFVGAMGHSRLERFLLGSVSAAVASRASCSVEVVR